jgi:hypothetical protein
VSSSNRPEIKCDYNFIKTYADFFLKIYWFDQAGINLTFTISKINATLIHINKLVQLAFAMQGHDVLGRLRRAFCADFRLRKTG